MVDSDLRRPGVHEHLGVTNNIGLADYLSGAKSVQDIIQPTRNAEPLVDPAGGGPFRREGGPAFVDLAADGGTHPSGRATV